MRYRRIPGYPGYDCNADVTDVRSYWMEGSGYTVSYPVRSLKPQRIGATIYYQLKNGKGKREKVKRSVLRELAFPVKIEPAMALKEFRTYYLPEAVRVAVESQRSDIHMMADDIAENVPGMGVKSALEVLAAIGAIMPENKPELESIKWELGL